MEIIQIVSIGIIGTVLSLTLKKQSPEFSLLIGIITGILIFLFLFDPICDVIDLLRQMADTAGISMTYMGIVLKVIGIAYIAEFGVQLCLDAGAGSIASKIELGGKVLIMLVSAPVLLALLDMVMNMMA